MGYGRAWLKGSLTKFNGGNGWRSAPAALAIVLVAACLTLGIGSRWVANHRAARETLAQLTVSRPAAGRSRLPFQLLQTSKQSSSVTRKLNPQSLMADLPLIFEPNQGQAGEDVKFVSRGAGYGLSLDQSGAVLAVTGRKRSSSAKGKYSPNTSLIRMQLVGANAAASMKGGELLPGKSNYFLGNDRSRWRQGIPQFAAVQYEDVYPGIDLVFYGHQGQLEYDFKVAPGADPRQAQLRFEGASHLVLQAGDLVLSDGGADVRLHAPRVYQTVGGKQETVDGRFVLRAGNRVGFEIGTYDRTRELVIDPTISYSTYFGGSGADTLPSIAVNSAGEIYLAGSTTSADLLTAHAFAGTSYQTTLKGAQNIFIVELDPTGGANGIKALTYLGGTGTDTLAGLAVDSANVYVGGSTTSTDFPTANGFQNTLRAATGTQHVFVSKLNVPLSTLSYSTYLSGTGTDIASAIAVDASQDVFVTGTTTSFDINLDQKSGFPSTQLPIPFQQSPAGTVAQFFVTEVNTITSGPPSVTYSTYFGGAGGTTANQVGGGIAVDPTGYVYFSGTTDSYNSGEGNGAVGGQQAGDFPILNAYQPCLDSPPPSTITYPVTCTAGLTATDTFVAKLFPKSTGAQLLFSTYFGGMGTDTSPALAIDTNAASIYITGTTNSIDFVVPTGSGAFQECLDTPVNPATLPCPAASGATDAYVARFSNPNQATGTTTTLVALSYFSYLGGTGNDSGLAIAADSGGGALVTGATMSSDFPTSVGAIQTALAGTQNAFFSRLYTQTTGGTSSQASYSTYFGGSGTDRGTSIAVDASLNTYIAGDTTSLNLQVQGAEQSTNAGSTDTFALKLVPVFDLCIQCVAPTLSPISGVVGAGNPVTITYTLTNGGPDLATNIAITGSMPNTVTFTSASVGSIGSCSSPVGNSGISTASCTIAQLQAGSTATVTFTATPTMAGNYSATATVTESGSTGSSVASASFVANSYTVSASPSSLTVPAGTTAAFTVGVNPKGSYGNNVTLSCGALPVGASCGFGQSTLSFSGPGGQNTQLNVTTTARPVVTISYLQRHGPMLAFWMMAPGMVLLGAGKRRRRRIKWIGMMTFVALIALQPACGKGKTQAAVSGTPSGTYTIPVTGTSGSYSSTSNITLTVL